MDSLKLEIVTPSGVIYDANALEVTLPGAEGEFGVLPRHASISTLLKAGVIDIVKEDKSIESILVNWGHVQVNETTVTVLADGAVALNNSGDGGVAQTLESAKKLLKDVSESKMALASVSAKIDHAVNR